MSVATSVERTVENYTITETIISAIAEAKGVSQTSLETPLYEIVDPDALEHLFEPTAQGGTRTSGKVVFTLDGCEVVVESSGQVVVTPISNRD